MDVDVQKLATLEEDLRKDLEAISRVRQLMALKNGTLSRPDDRQIALPIGPQGKGRRGGQSDVDKYPNSLVSTVESIINSDPNVRWTTTKMVAHLKSWTFPSGQRSRSTRLANA